MLVNWRGLMAPPNIGAEDKKALEDVLAKMVKSDAWKKLLEQREWVDLYMPSEPFAAFVKGGAGPHRSALEGARPRLTLHITQRNRGSHDP